MTVFKRHCSRLSRAQGEGPCLIVAFQIGLAGSPPESSHDRIVCLKGRNRSYRATKRTGKRFGECSRRLSNRRYGMTTAYSTSERWSTRKSALNYFQKSRMTIIGFTSGSNANWAEGVGRVGSTGSYESLQSSRISASGLACASKEHPMGGRLASYRWLLKASTLRAWSCLSIVLSAL